MAIRDFEPLPYYRWYWRDFRASRAVQRMDYRARGLYREMLDECWVSGSIPDNVDRVADITNTPPDVVATWWSQVRPMFRKKGRRLYNDRIERERTTADQLRAEKSLAGKKSAEVRKQKKATDVEQVLTGVQQNPTSSSSSSTKQSISSSSAARSSNDVIPLTSAPAAAGPPGRASADERGGHPESFMTVLRQVAPDAVPPSKRLPA